MKKYFDEKEKDRLTFKDKLILEDEKFYLKKKEDE